MTRRIQQGFTLIELVVVIAILGILAAVALPRFTDMQTRARVAKATALMASARTAAGNVKAAAVAAGVNCNAVTGGTVVIEGATITLNNCYPTANAAGIFAAANITGNDQAWTGTGGTAGGSTVWLQVNGAPNSGSCTFSYTSPDSGGTPPTFVPTFTLTTSGC